MSGHHGGDVGLLLLVPPVLFWVYLAAALRERERGGWSHWRTASFGAGAALLAAAVLLPGDDLVAHMWRHLLVGMLAPLGLVLTVGGLYLLHLTPLYAASVERPWLHMLVLLHFLLGGYAFSWAVAGSDPGPRRAGVPTRLVVLGFAVAGHATLALLVRWRPAPRHGRAARTAPAPA